MLEARTRMFSRDYTLIDNGIETGAIQQSAWKEKATLFIGGYTYAMYHTGAFSNQYRLELNGTPLADAQKSSFQHNYEIACAEGHFSLKRRSLMSSDYILLVNGQEIGSLSREKALSRNVLAQLPGISPVISGFMVWLVVISWQESQQAAAIH